MGTDPLSIYVDSVVAEIHSFRPASQNLSIDPNPALLDQAVRLGPGAITELGECPGEGYFLSAERIFVVQDPAFIPKRKDEAKPPD